MHSPGAEWITYRAPSGSIRAFSARPALDPPLAALIVIHGVNGLGAHMERNCLEFANEGYLAIAPDIYSKDPGFKTHDVRDIELAAHMGKDPARHAAFLANYPPAKQDAIRRAREWISARPAHTYIDIVRSCYDHLKERPEVASIGCLGYCMGGRLTGELAATGAELAAGVIYYGDHPNLELVKNIRCPIEGHYASTDKNITGKVPDFAAAMKAAGKAFTYYVYEANHGFSLSPELKSYNESATKLSMQRIKVFLARYLRASAESRSALLLSPTSDPESRAG